MIEHERDRAGFGKVAAILGEDRAHFAGGAVAIVGQGLDDHRNAARAIALVANLVVAFGVGALRLLDRPLDIILLHVLAPRSLGLKAGSGSPSFADTVISRASLPNSLERALSWRPLRCMMFLNWEWPAIRSRPFAATRR